MWRPREDRPPGRLNGRYAPPEATPAKTPARDAASSIRCAAAPRAAPPPPRPLRRPLGPRGPPAAPAIARGGMMRMRACARPRRISMPAPQRDSAAAARARGAPVGSCADRDRSKPGRNRRGGMRLPAPAITNAAHVVPRFGPNSTPVSAPHACTCRSAISCRPPHPTTESEPIENGPGSSSRTLDSHAGHLRKAPGPQWPSHQSRHAGKPSRHNSESDSKRLPSAP